MKYGRTYNFSAGPATMPEPVLEEIRDEMMNYRGSGMCVMEMSHRSKVFQQIIDEAEADLRELMQIRQLQSHVHPGRRYPSVRHDSHEPDEERQGRLHRNRRLVQEGHCGSQEIRRSDRGRLLQG